MRKGFEAALVLGGLLASAVVGSATLHSVDVEHRAGRYQLVSDSHVEAPPEAIFRVLTDYEHFGRLSSIYTDYGFMEPDPDGTPLVFTTMEACVLFFCKRMHRVERLETRAPRWIHTVTLPEQSDFRYGEAEWILEPAAGGTKMSYRLGLEPDFWVPPVVGPWLLKRSLRGGGERVVGRIERLAREIAGDAAAAP